MYMYICMYVYMCARNRLDPLTTLALQYVSLPNAAFPTPSAGLPAEGAHILLGTTQTGSYQTGSYQKGRFIPPKPKRLHF